MIKIKPIKSKNVGIGKKNNKSNFILKSEANEWKFYWQIAHEKKRGRIPINNTEPPLKSILSFRRWLFCWCSLSCWMNHAVYESKMAIKSKSNEINVYNINWVNHSFKFVLRFLQKIIWCSQNLFLSSPDVGLIDSIWILNGLFRLIVICCHW